MYLRLRVAKGNPPIHGVHGMYVINGKALTITKADMNSFERAKVDELLAVIGDINMAMWLIEHGIRVDRFCYTVNG